MNNQKLRIVMFPHPANEFIPPQCVPQGLYIPCGWNVRRHARRLLLTDGDYIDNNGVKCAGKIAFWSEWEANTLVARLPRLTTCPPDAKYVHKPQCPTPCPGGHSLSNDDQCCMNTDPCVFGRTFKYALCRQYRNGRATFLQSLAPGSLIVFCGRMMGRFYLDTVFVVGESTPYVGPDKNPSVISCSQEYRTLTLDQTKGPLTFYRSVTWQKNDVDQEMYSFAPGRVVQCGVDDATLTIPLRERCPLNFKQLNNIIGSKFFNENNWRTATKVEATSIVVQHVWKELLNQTQLAHFVSAVHFDWPSGGIANGAIS